MKKIIALALATVMTLTLAACGGNTNETTLAPTDAPTDGTTVEETTSEATTEEPTTEATKTQATTEEPTVTTSESDMTSHTTDDDDDIDEPTGPDDDDDQSLQDFLPVVERGSNEVELTWAADFVQSLSDEDLAAFKAEYDQGNVVENPDGTMTVKIANDKFDEMIEEMRVQIDTNLKEFVGDGTGLYKSIDVSDDYSEVVMNVNRDQYDELSINVAPILISSTVMIYQHFKGEEYDLELVTKDAATDEVLDTMHFPEAFEEDDDN